MTLSLRYNGRLPGVLCEPSLPLPGEQPLTLDVAAFVGFAERGPLHVPVAVEDLSQYQAVFGGDLLLARDAGPPLFAQLPGAVKAFFDNGGRRCYVVRVAGMGAYANRFRLPGMLVLDGGEARLVRLAAAWPGRWSDALSVGAALRARPLRVVSYRREGDAGLSIDLELPAELALAAGDLLRLRGDAAGQPVAYAVVTSAGRTMRDGEPAPSVNALRGLPITASARIAASYAPAEPQPLLAAERLGFAGWEPLPAAALWIEAIPGAFRLAIAPPPALRPGDLLRLQGADGARLLLPVAALELDVDEGSPPGGPLLLARGAELLRELSPAASLGQLRQLELLGFDLFVREGGAMGEQWPERRFASGTARWTAVLARTPAVGPPDDRLFLEGLPPGQSARLRLDEPGDASGDESQEQPAEPPLYLPLGMPDLPDAERFVGAEPTALSLAAKDGLERFDAALFLDAEMAGMGVSVLADEAERRLFLSRERRPPRGAHSLLPIDEVALIAAPDLTQRSWREPFDVPSDPPPQEPPPEPEPDWSNFQRCERSAQEAPPEPAPCVAPFEYELPPDAPTLPDLRQQLALLPLAEPPAAYGSEELLTAQAALVRICAARADAVAVLSLPGHYGVREALEWRRALAARAPSLLAGAELSYAAVYHPWLLTPEPSAPELAPLRAAPPDGAVCGMAAARALARGPWVAPANHGLRGAVGLTPELSDDEYGALFDGQVNVLRRRPGQFLTLSAHTLSHERQLIQLSVRRLLILLRKLALRRGMRYVFEPNNARFRQLVQLAFERLMRELTARGALAAYQVVTGPEINTQNDEDNGRFIVALKVAPTLPIGFITVTLLRSGEGLLEILER
jgi:hypothetical protein